MKRLVIFLIILTLFVGYYIITPFSLYADQIDGKRAQKPMDLKQDLQKLTGTKRFLGVRVDQLIGVLVNHVFQSSAAEKAGIKPGDIILMVNNKGVTNPQELRNAIAESKLNIPILLHILRGNLILEVTAIIEEAPSSGQSAEPLQSATAIPSDIDVTQTSDDPTYAYTMENPVKLGDSVKGFGPLMEKKYLTHLRDKNFKPVRFERLGSKGNFSKGSDGHIVDIYKLTDSEDNEHIIYIDMYHPEHEPLKCKAPKGMYFWK